MKKFNRVIIFQNGGVGDFLMTIFLAEQLKENGVSEKINIVVHRVGGFLGGFIKDYPYISLTEVSRKNPLSLLKILGLFGAGNLVILPPTIGKFRLKLKLLARSLAVPGSGMLLGFQDSGLLCKELYSEVLPYNIDQMFVETMNDILRTLGIGKTEKIPKLKITPAPGTSDRLGLLGKKYVFFHPLGSSPRRCFSEDDAVSLLNFIFSSYPDLDVLISGASHEEERIDSIIKRSNSPERSVKFINGSAPEIADLLGGALLFVGVDTGITHMASFMGKKALVVAKNGTPHWLPFYNKNAKIIYRFEEDKNPETSEEYLMAKQKGRLRPLRDIPIATVCAELGKMLS